MTSFHSPWMDWKSNKEGKSAVSSLEGKNLTPDEGSVSTVSSLDSQIGIVLSTVSTVSSIKKHF